MSFKRVTKANPCPVCRHSDWCRVFADGWVECMRVQSDKPAKSGGWMWRVPGTSTPLPRPSPPAPLPSDGRGWQATPKINAAKLMRDWRAVTSPTALAEFAASLGLSVDSLTAVGAAWAAAHAAWAFPMCDGHGNVVGIRLRNERGKFAVRGSKQGLFVSAECGVPNAERADVLFVCEGPTDTAAALDLGLFAIGRPNCCCGGLEIRTYARRQAVSRVVIIADNDRPGLDGARKVGGELKLPFAIYVPPAKDVREFVRLGGTRAMIENTLNNTVWHS
jgi:hypothetical protein